MRVSQQQHPFVGRIFVGAEGRHGWPRMLGDAEAHAEGAGIRHLGQYPFVLSLSKDERILFRCPTKLHLGLLIAKRLAWFGMCRLCRGGRGTSPRATRGQ